LVKNEKENQRKFKKLNDIIEDLNKKNTAELASKERHKKINTDQETEMNLVKTSND
jgi:hypothetical protein